MLNDFTGADKDYIACGLFSAVSLRGEERLTAADFFQWMIRWDQ